MRLLLFGLALVLLVGCQAAPVGREVTQPTVKSIDGFTVK